MTESVCYKNREDSFKRYQETSRKYFIPYIEKWRPIKAGMDILELGCEEGGILYPFADRCCRVTGIDASVQKIDNANLFFWIRGKNGDFYAGDFLDESSGTRGKLFDVIIVHRENDHVDNERDSRLLEKIKTLLSPGGIVYVESRSKMSVERFAKHCRRAGMKILGRTLWLVDPRFKVKFNLKPIRMWSLFAGIPYIRNCFCTSSHYILSP